MFYIITFILLISADPNTLLQEANSAFQQNQFTEAVPKFEQANSVIESTH